MKLWWFKYSKEFLIRSLKFDKNSDSSFPHQINFDLLYSYSNDNNINALIHSIYYLLVLKVKVLLSYLSLFLEKLFFLTPLFWYNELIFNSKFDCLRIFYFLKIFFKLISTYKTWIMIYLNNLYKFLYYFTLYHPKIRKKIIFFQSILCFND